MNFLDRIFGRRVRALQRQNAMERRRFANQLGSISAANGGVGRGGRGSWMGMPQDEDAANQEYARDRQAIMQRAQDLDVNNPDVGGFHRTRVAQILGAGVRFKHTPIADEVGLTEAQAVEIGEKVDRLRKLHSENGGFDAQKGHDWEGKRQEQAGLTMFVYGCCLIHRVWGVDPDAILPLSIELIPGSRISTPYKEYGNPLVSFGVRYTDKRRSRVVGYYVRRVSSTVGNNFVPEFEWDWLPVEDCSLLSLTEPAGIDQALPLCTRSMRMLRNRGEFLENTVEAARAQSAHYGVVECAPGVDPYNLAADDRAADLGATMKNSFIDVGSGVRMYYAMSGEKVTWSSAKLPEPEFQAFIDKTDERLARGLVSSLARFTRKVDSSYAGGRLEAQQDDPIIDQYRLALRSAWHKVNKWFLEAVWLTGAVDLPGYGKATRHFWNEFSAEFPGKVDIDPAKTAAASEKNLMLRKTDPIQEIESTGADPRQRLRNWAKWMKMAREEEQKAGLAQGSLDILFSGKSVTTSAGDDVGAPDPTDEPQPGEDAGGGDGGRKPAPKPKKKSGAKQ